MQEALGSYPINPHTKDLPKSDVVTHSYNPNTYTPIILIYRGKRIVS